MNRCIDTYAYLQRLLDYDYIRRLLKTASKKATWWDRWWADPFMRLIMQVREERSSEFKELYEGCYFSGLPMRDLLKQGYTMGLQTLIGAKMDLSTPGRIVACLAFLTFVLDDWAVSKFSFDYVVDSIAIIIWQQSRYRTMQSGPLEADRASVRL